MSSDVEWRESFGELKLPFMGAAGKILDGNFHVDCPNCHKSTLRFYYHEFNKQKGTGTLWAWCPSCRVMTHLPRVEPAGRHFPDPFRDIDDFGKLEGRNDDPLVARLDKLWDDGKIGLPVPQDVRRRR
ncbi:MAG: hypothetical protein K2X72_15050 [Reyranella sp.]|nr:hypothetical protein [Reyranella sp.]